eukprot:11856-Heterococcus_DN1.PRE.3
MDLTDKRRQAMAKGAADTKGKKGSKATSGSSSGGATSGKYAFAEFDPNKRLRKQGKLGKSQFKSKAKFKRRNSILCSSALYIKAASSLCTRVVLLYCVDRT